MRFGTTVSSIVFAAAAGGVATAAITGETGQLINKPASQMRWERSAEGAGFAPLAP